MSREVCVCVACVSRVLRKVRVCVAQGVCVCCVKCVCVA